MGTIYVPPSRNIIEPRVELNWGQTLLASITGWEQANFAGIVGGETVTIQRNYAVPVLVTMVAGDITPALVAARINLALPGLASIVNGRIVLSDLNQVKVTAISQADFMKIGLPELTRDVGAAPSNRYQVDLEASPNTDQFSVNYIKVRDGVNKLGVWMFLAGNDAQNKWGVSWAVEFGNGVEGEPPFATEFGAFPDLMDEQVDFGSDPDEMTVERFGYLPFITSIGVINGMGITRIYNVDVPVGARSARIFVQGARSDGPNAWTAANPPPRRPPTVGFALIGGSR